MRKYNSLFFSALLFLIACGGDGIPPGIIKQQEMTNLLTEVHIVDGSLYNIMQQPDSLYKLGTGKYLALFKSFHTDSVTFKNSLKFYAAHPEQLETMYQQVTINLKQKTDSINALVKKNAKSTQ